MRRYILLGWFVTHTKTGRKILADAWEDGWDRSRSTPEPACPSDFNPFEKEAS